MIDPTSISATTGKPNWNVSTLISGTGPVTTSVTKLQDITNSNLWVYFGTGRFYYNGDDPSTIQEKIYAVKDPCYSTGNVNISGVTPTAGGTINHMDGTCTASVTGTLVDQTGTATTAPSSTIPGNAPGWSVTLGAAAASTNSMTERVISDPTASPNGAVFFTTFVPNSNPCTFGGNSYLWALGYNTGASPPSSVLQGQALVQVSSGALQQLSLNSIFNSTNLSYNGRRSSVPMSGAPPVSQGLSLIRRPTPLQKILHFMEK
jgi:type IV pilus assembly protein PilY1